MPSSDPSHPSYEECSCSIFKLLSVHRGTLLLLRRGPCLCHGLRQLSRRDLSAGLQVTCHVCPVGRLERLLEGGEHGLTQRSLRWSVRSSGHRCVQALRLTDLVCEHGAREHTLPEQLEGHGLVIVTLDALQEGCGAGTREPALTAQAPEHLRVHDPTDPSGAAATGGALRQKLKRHSDVIVECRSVSC